MPVSPLQSLVAGIRNDPYEATNQLQNAFLGGQQGRLNQQAIQGNQVDLQQQQRQITQGEGMRNAQYLNRLGKTLLNSDESAWEQTLTPHIPLLTQMGFKPEQLAGMIRQQIQSVVQQTDAVINSVSPQNQSMVRSTENLPGGLTKTVMSDGSVRITNAAGETLQGQAAAEAVEDSRKLGIETERATYGAREVGKLDTQLDKKPLLEERITRSKENAKNATGQVKEYFGQLANIQTNIANYNEAINLIDQGAGTGVIQGKLPSIRAASQKLDNVKNRLGLDVVSNTTFGALSEAELAFAIDTALPTNIEGEDLKQWLTQKRDAQQKLADYIDNAIQFLSIEGNSLQDLQSEAPRQEVNASQQTQVLRFDAQGNPI